MFTKYDLRYCMIWFWIPDGHETIEPADEIMVLITQATSEGWASLRIRAVSPEP